MPELMTCPHCGCDSFIGPTAFYHRDFDCGTTISKAGVLQSSPCRIRELSVALSAATARAEYLESGLRELSRKRRNSEMPSLDVAVTDIGKLLKDAFGGGDWLSAWPEHRLGWNRKAKAFLVAAVEHGYAASVEERDQLREVLNSNNRDLTELNQLRAELAAIKQKDGVV